MSFNLKHELHKMSGTWNKVKDYVPAAAGIAAAALMPASAPAILGYGLAAAGIGATSNSLAKKAQKEAEARQNQYNIEAEQREFEYTKQLNDLANAYNTPEAQMDRYIKAGINPYMASVSSGTQGSAGSVSTHATQATPFETLPQSMQRSFAIASAGMDLKERLLGLQAQTIRNEYLPAQIQATLENMVANSSLAKYSALTAEHDWNIIKNQKITTSKESGFLPRVDRLFTKGSSNLNDAYNEAMSRSWW